MPRSPYVLAALDEWRRVREDFQVYVQGQYERAESDCNGVMLNERGKRAHVDAVTLFYGPRARVDAYASRELLDWFAEHGRMTFAQYEREHSRQPMSELF